MRAFLCFEETETEQCNFKSRAFMDITEVARQSGVPSSTLRFHEEKGLIASVGRKGLRRLFAPDRTRRTGKAVTDRAGALGWLLAGGGCAHVRRRVTWNARRFGG